MLRGHRNKKKVASHQQQETKAFKRFIPKDFLRDLWAGRPDSDEALVSRKEFLRGIPFTLNVLYYS